MYLVSIYFDEKTEKRIRQYIKQVAEKSGNRYMIEGEVPPHITISAFETNHEKEVLERLESGRKELKRGILQWASIGSFPPYVIFLAPVVNEYLHSLAQTVFDSISEVDEVSISRFYQPFQWLPHTTIGKKLSSEEMEAAFKVLQKSFRMFSGEVVRIGVAKTNPYRDLVSWELSKECFDL